MFQLRLNLPSQFNTQGERGRIAGLLLVGAFTACIVGSDAVAETYSIGPDGDWFKLLSGKQLKPGDEVVLQGGTYSDSRRLVIQLQGTAAQPITIRGAEGQRVVFRRPDAKQNTLNLEGTQFLHLRDFEITGGAAGIRIRPHGELQPTGVVLEGLHIHHVGGVAVTCNHTGGDYSQMIFRRNHIHHTAGHGEAFYLGGNQASAIFHDSVIEQNYIHHLMGPNVSQGDGIEIKQGSYGNRIVANVIHDTGYPGVIVYGTAGRARNEIRDNVIWNTSDNGIQAAADALIENNYVSDSRGAGIYSRAHQGAIPGHLTIRHNVVTVRGSAPALRIIPASSTDESQRYSGPIEIVRNSLVHSMDGDAVRIGWPRQVRFQDNRGRGSVRGLDAALSPITDEPSPPSVVQLEDHPAWKHLERGDVVRRFTFTE